MSDPELGLQLCGRGLQPPPGLIKISQEAERLGFGSSWTAEPRSSDAFIQLATAELVFG